MMIDPPPREWFEKLPDDYDPVNNPEHPLIWIDRETGRVAALVAPHDECILDGNESYRCVLPPKSKTGLGYANNIGGTRTAEGDLIRTANLGGRVNHAGEVGMSMAQHHYANTATRWARVRYFADDDNNIYAGGSLVPWIDPMQVVEIEGSALSGDWRWVEKLSNLELAGSQLVNVPGFRPSHHRQFALAASMDGKQVRGMWAAADTPHTGVLFVALPAKGEVPYEDAHVTLAYVGDLQELGELDPRPLLEVLTTAAVMRTPFMAKVSGKGELGPDKAAVLLLEDEGLQWLRDRLEMLDEGKFPSWIPHMTTGYGKRPPANPPEGIVFDRVALWAGPRRWELPLVGEQMIMAAANALGVDPADLFVFNIDADRADADWLKPSTGVDPDILALEKATPRGDSSN